MATVFTASIAANADDGTYDHTFSAPVLNPDGPGACQLNSEPTDGFFRFTNVTIPRASVITACTLTLTSGGLGNWSGTVYGEKTANATAISTAQDAIDRTRTTIGTPSTMVATEPIGNEAMPIVGLAAVIQELVNQASWASGNALMLFLQNSSGLLTFKTKESGGGEASISITYNLPVAAGTFKRGKL